MRILVVATCPFPAPRGSPLLIERTARGLARLGHAVRLLAPTARAPGCADPPGLTRVRAGRALDIGRSRPQLARIHADAALLVAALRERPDVILGHNADGGLVAGLAGAWMRVPAVYFRHSDTAEELALHGPGIRILGRVLEAAARTLCTRTVVLAPEPRVGGSIDALPPPADPDEAQVEPANGSILYYEGNRDRYQNLGWLAAALRAARCVRPGADLLVAASPGERPARADLALVPRSLPGGYPMKLLACQVAGIPAVCVESAAPGLVDGVDAFVVPGRGSPLLFAERVAAALRDDEARERVRVQARARALARHDPARVAALLEASLGRATSAPGGG
jgi:glycosyltransferase involved in cell wall biosynthesis